MNIGIIAPISNSLPTYSIASVIRTQCEMLHSQRHNVTVICNVDFSGPGFPGASLLKIIPETELVDYKSKLNISKEHEEYATEFATIFSPRVLLFDTLFTHDLVFTGWYAPLALSIMSLSAENPKTKWYHWIHSYPFVQRDWFDMAHYTGDHYIVYPTVQDIKYIGEIFNTNKVISVPHILDCKSIYRLSDQAKVLVDLIPSIQTADIVQCYPASSDRLNSKGTRELVNLFGLLKKSGRSVCLIIVNQFAGRRDSQLVDPVYYYEKVARRCGLDPYVDFIFTSELLNGKYAEGMPQRTLFELMSFANLFVMPSKSESFGLGLLEAMMASGVICVANEHLNLPIKQHTSFDFKAINSIDQNISMNEMAPLVDWIIEQLENNAVVKARTVIRQQFNPLFIYNNYYKPLLASVPCVSESSLLPKSFENLEF